MADIVNLETRHRMMSGMRRKDTKPELQVRRLLFARGFDILYMRKLCLANRIWCSQSTELLFLYTVASGAGTSHLFKWPSTRSEFWRQKINGNSGRD